jgi:hypothetical protein
MAAEIKILLFTFLSFGLLGLLDDMKKTFVLKSDFFGLRLRHKLILEIIIAAVISFWLVTDLHINIFYLPLFGVIHMGWWFIPFSMFTIISFANAFNITTVWTDWLRVQRLPICSDCQRVILEYTHSVYLHSGSAVCWVCTSRLSRGNS